MRLHVLFICLLCLACSALADDPRTAWLQTTLLADNRLVIERFPNAAAGKFAKMADSPYRYLRGTSAQYLRDVLDAGPHHQRAMHTSAAAQRRAIIGDAHLENVGSYLAGRRRLIVDFNDFDAATFGPFQLDVWRLTTSIMVAFPDEELPVLQGWLEAVPRGYAQTINALAEGESPPIFDEANPESIVFEDLLERARRDGDGADRLATYTRVQRGKRRMFLGEVDPPGTGFVGDIVFDVSPAERAGIEAALRAWPASVVGRLSASEIRIKGISRRLGAGVSSYPLPRFYVLLEGPTPAVDDDWLIELKESADPPLLPNLLQYPWPRYRHNAERVVDMQRRLQAYVDDDPLLGVALLDPQSFRVRRREGYQKNISVDRLQRRYRQGRWSAADLQRAFENMGALLARAHAGARGTDGERGLPSIAAAIDGDVDGFVTQAVGFARGYAPVVLADYDRFRALLDEAGPLLGYRPDGAF
jgi:uncharacterized protein (DUF2252 family)